jgi:hypothetical protein
MTDQRDALCSDDNVVEKKKYKPIRKEQLNEIRYRKLSKSANVNNAKRKRDVPKHSSRWQDQTHHLWTSEVPCSTHYLDWKITAVSAATVWAGRSGVRMSAAARRLSVLKTSRPALRPTQVPGGKVTGREAAHSLPPKLGMSGAIPPITQYAFMGCKGKLYLITHFTRHLSLKG